MLPSYALLSTFDVPPMPLFYPSTYLATVLYSKKLSSHRAWSATVRFRFICRQTEITRPLESAH